MIGQTISHYKVLAKIGEGGMGVVYKAEDIKLKRIVALKFLSSHAINIEEYKSRFVTEAQAAASLDHSNICTVYEIDEADGKFFIAMAYIEGQTLMHKIENKQLTLGRLWISLFKLQKVWMLRMGTEWFTAISRALISC